MEWVFISLKCCGALDHIHQKGYIHCDIKHDNIILHNSAGIRKPVIIDFGKMKKPKNVRIYKLNSKEQDRYLRFYKHIAPEIIWGRSSPSPASNIYSFVQVIGCILH